MSDASEANVFWGTGRRKTSTARVRVKAGSGVVQINGKPLEDYFKHENFSRVAVRPLVTVELKDKVDVFVNVDGGGSSGQAGAVSHGISRALLKFDPELRPVLKKAGLLTRDHREKERKKAGQPGARKRFQFSKR
ncbi:MAG: 30S ribosomal protein S9 [Verrucomicrobia bacterium]|nr:MAG: 30S ribosomal protein S9 [Verrucomicrobiota bacterium]